MENNITKRDIEKAIMEHTHDGILSQRVQFDDIEFYNGPFNVTSGTIATTGNTDTYFIAPHSLKVLQVDFSATDALATSDTNYITWTITNLGQSGASSNAILSSADSNTTKATGGSAIAANTKRTLILSSTLTDLNIIGGDRIRIRAAVTNTLANTVTFPVYLIQLTQ